MRIREIVEADHAVLLDMNNAAAPAVNELTAAEFAALVTQCSQALAAVDGDDVVGMVLVVPPDTDYHSDNYRWFAKHYGTDFHYLDRIVVNPQRRSGGVGAALHAAVAERARADGVPRIAAEVNLDPPNPRSLAFHQRLGFAEVGQYRGGSGKLCCMLARELVSVDA